MSHHNDPAAGVAEVSWTDGRIAVVRISTDIDDRSTPALREPLRAAARGHRHLVLDLSEVGIITPGGLALIVRVRQQLRQDRDGTLCLAAASRFVIAVLHTMRLHRAFPTFPDSIQAVAWLRGNQDAEAAFTPDTSAALLDHPAPVSTRGQLASGRRATR